MKNKEYPKRVYDSRINSTRKFLNQEIWAIGGHVTLAEECIAFLIHLSVASVKKERLKVDERSIRYTLCLVLKYSRNIRRIFKGLRLILDWECKIYFFFFFSSRGPGPLNSKMKIEMSMLNRTTVIVRFRSAGMMDVGAWDGAAAISQHYKRNIQTDMI